MIFKTESVSLYKDFILLLQTGRRAGGPKIALFLLEFASFSGGGFLYL